VLARAAGEATGIVRNLLTRPVPKFGEEISPRGWIKAVSGSSSKGKSVSSLLNMIQRVDPAADTRRWDPLLVGLTNATAGTPAGLGSPGHVQKHNPMH